MSSLIKLKRDYRMNSIETERSGATEKKLVLDNDKLPLTIIYKEKRYVLILTKNDKLILNKYED